MHFSLLDGTRFEIPDDWWQAAGMNGFVPKTEFYAFGSDEGYPELPVTVVPMASIDPPRRNPNVTLDFGGFRRDDLVRILKGFISSSRIPPVRARATRAGRYHYCVYNGLHRFYASAAVGYIHLPIVAAPGWFGD